MNAAQYLLYVAFLTPCFERWPMVVSRGYRWPTPESRDLTTVDRHKQAQDMSSHALGHASETLQ